MLKYWSLSTILVFTFCLLGFLAESSSDTPSPNSNTTCQDMLDYTRAEFSIDVCLINQGSQYAAMISLRNNNTFDVYELKVSQSYIDQNAQMSLLYQGPQTFFSLLKQEESTITTNSNAQILIQNKFFKVLRLIPRKQILDTTDNITNKLNILQSALKEMIENELKLNQSLAQTKKQLQIQKDLVNKVKEQSNKEIMMLKNNITQISSQMDLLRQEKDAQIAQLKNETLTLNTNIEKENQSNELQSNQIKQIQQVLIDKLSLLLILQNVENYALQKSNNNLKLKYKQNAWFGFFKTPHIQAGKITRLQVRQTKTTSPINIMYGVSTDKTFGIQRPFQNLEYKSYHALDGKVFQNGVGRAGGAAINDGTVVTIIADLINWKISWEVNGNKLAEAEISAAMMANNLYFIITMRWANNEVEILDYF